MTSRRKTTKSERRIIETLIFTESFETLLDETGLSEGILRDDLINLLNSRMIVAKPLDSSEKEFSPYIDTDRLRDFSFQATKSGLISLKPMS